MSARSGIDPARFLSEQLAQASPDLLRQMLGAEAAPIRLAPDERRLNRPGFGAGRILPASGHH